MPFDLPLTTARCFCGGTLGPGPAAHLAATTVRDGSWGYIMISESAQSLEVALHVWSVYVASVAESCARSAVLDDM
jgi:hypothetical protein